LFIVEYNGKFPPPLRWRMTPDDSHVWDGSDYLGASLSTLEDLFSQHGYRLICCNITGTNAFFVPHAAAGHFRDVPERMEDIFVPPRYFLYRTSVSGHAPSPRTIESMLLQLPDDNPHRS
jgi:hypothetical protein